MHDETWSKVSVVLMDRQVQALDRVLRRIEAQSGVTITRAALIRALVDGVMTQGFDVSNITSEPQLRQRIAERVRPLIAARPKPSRIAGN